MLLDTYRVACPYAVPLRVPPTSSLGSSSKPRIFIASIHWNNEVILRSHWNNAVLNLVHHLGSENVYIHVLESGSWDNSKGALRELDSELDKMGIQRTIELDPKTHKDEIDRVPSPSEPGWVQTSPSKRELRRIPYLSNLRNKAIQTLQRLADDGKQSLRFDKILWLNDVVFTVCHISKTSIFPLSLKH